MNKYTVMIGLTLGALLWTAGAMAEHPTKWNHGKNTDQVNHGSKGHHGSKAHHSSSTIQEGEHLREISHQEIRRGQELMKMGNKADGQALIHKGTEDIQAGNKMIHEGKSQKHYYSREKRNRY